MERSGEDKKEGGPPIPPVLNDREKGKKAPAVTPAVGRRKSGGKSGRKRREFPFLRGFLQEFFHIGILEQLYQLRSLSAHRLAV